MGREGAMVVTWVGVWVQATHWRHVPWLLGAALWRGWRCLFTVPANATHVYRFKLTVGGRDVLAWRVR